MRHDLVTNVAILRISLARASSERAIPERIAGLYDAISGWMNLPSPARGAYRAGVANCVMDVAAAIRVDPEVEVRGRLVVALSLLDAGVKIGLLEPQAKKVKKRREALLKQLQEAETDHVMIFLHIWRILLRYRVPAGMPRRELFAEDLAATLEAMIARGWPRRAAAVANAFARELGPIGKIVARHFPLEEERRRIDYILSRLEILPPIPLSFSPYVQALREVFAAPLVDVPMHTSKLGEIRVGVRRFGATTEPFL